MTKYAEFRPGGRAGPPPDGLVVRQAAGADADAIAELSQARDGGILEEVRALVAASLARRDTDGLVLVAETPGEGVIAYARVARFAAPPRAPENVAPDGLYLTGVIVGPDRRRRGVGAALTAARLTFIDERAPESFYFTNARNEASIALHARYGFVEATRDFWHPTAQFDGGVGVLFRRAHGAGFTPAPGRSPG